MANITRQTGSLHIRIGALILASALMAVGCTQAIARRDVFERSDFRIGRSLESARRTCQERQPNNAPPSAGAYERCVVEVLRGAESISASQ